MDPDDQHNHNQTKSPTREKFKFSSKSLKKLLSFGKSNSGSEDFHRKDPNDPYLYITNFEQVTDEECLAADKRNEGIYKKELQTYQAVTSLMERENASFKKPDAPKRPPKPSNLEQLHLYRQKHIKTIALDQSEAVIYLLNLGKKYVRSKSGDPNEFEAYEAIELAEKIKKNCPGDHMFQIRSENAEWVEQSEMASQEIKKAQISRVQSVYELSQKPDFEQRVRSATYSAGSYSKGGIYPTMSEMPPDSYLPVASAPPMISPSFSES